MATRKTKTPTAAELAANWEEKYAALKAAQDEEMTARLAVAALIPDPKEGTNSLEVDSSLTIKVVQKYNYSIDQAALASVLEDMPEGSEDRLVRYKPDLKLSAYRELPEQQREIFDAAVTINRGTPAVQIVRKDATPKPKRK